jgi:class 3 adenylate cyclase/tetratricopeptide (TPR) repeat protein
VAGLLVKEPARRLDSAAELWERLHRLEEELGPWREPSKPVLPQRRQVTLVSCRLAGLRGLVASLDPEDSGELQSEFHRFCSQVLQRHHGSMTLSVAEEVLACFGYPLAREEDAERAVRAGLQLVSDFAQVLPQLARLGLAIQVGIHTDVVGFDAVPPELRGRMPALQGAAPRVASALARQTAPGGVGLSGSAWALVRGAFEAECLGSRALEGLPEGQEVELWQVRGERKAASRFERTLVAGSLTPLVGRERELERLKGAWAQARAGKGACLLLSGEAGIGKSRLIQELCDPVAPGSSLLRAQCWPSFTNSAFRPILELLGRQVPSLHGEELSMLAALEQQTERKRKVLGLLLEEFLRMARERPVLLVVEDLHWADPSTLELLSLLGERVEEVSLFLLLSARTEFQPPWRHSPRLHRLVLERLSVESTAALVKEVVGDRHLPEETVRQLVARTDGIPLFVEELTRMVLERAPAESLRLIPVTLQELLLARLDALPAHQKALAQLCAVVGRTFRQALLSRLLAWDESSLRKELVGLLSSGLLRREQDEAGVAYQFRHALFQEAAYQSLPRSLRRQHHQRVAQTLVEHFPETAEQQPEVLAHHYIEAGAPAQAIRYSVRAAEHAILQSGGLEAIAQLKGALKLLRRLPDSEALLHEEMQLLNALGILLMEIQGYGSPEVEQTYARALELFRQKGEALPQLDLLWLGLGSYFTLGGKFALAEELVEQLFALAHRRQDSVLLIHASRMLGWILLHRGECTRALKEFEQLRHLTASPEESRWGLTEKLWVYVEVDDQVAFCVLYMVCGQLQRAARNERELQSTLRELSHATTLAYGMLGLAMTCQLRRDARGALRWSERAAPVAAGPQFHPMVALAQGVHGWSLVKGGQVSQGLELLRSSCARLERLSARSFLPYFLGLLGESCLGVGRLQEGWVAVREGLRVAEETGARLYKAELQRLRGELLWRAGKREPARHSFLRALVVARRQGALLLELRATVSLGRVLRELGRPGVVRRRLERLLGRFDPGVELVDLQEARALLSSFAGTESPPPSPTSHPG